MIVRGISYAELGLQYELHVLSLLSRYLFELKHSGGRGDGGIDLRGTWRLPDSDPLPSLVQCKNIAAKCPPTVVRELEGVASRLPRTMALLTCSQSSSELARQRMIASPWPLLFLHIRPGCDQIEEAVMSEGLRNVLPHFSITTKMQIDYSSMKLQEQLLFTFHGKPLGTGV